MGGALRQSGILAAMCHHALDHHVDRLADDHALAQAIAGTIRQMPKVAGMLPVETNIIIFDLTDDACSAPELAERLMGEGIQIGAFGERRVRIVTHLDVDNADGETLCKALAKHLG